MFENSGPVDLFNAVIQLGHGGVAAPSTRAALRDAAGLWTVAAFHAEDDRAVHADVWERHPKGHEVLCVLAGAIDVHLRERGTVTVAAGQSFVVPTGQWHRLSVREPADLLGITPRVDTRHEQVRS